MSEAGERLLSGAEEMLAIAKGEQPAARIHINGHDYVPASELDRAEAKLAGVEKERDEARKWASDWHAVVDATCTILGFGLLDADQVVNSVRNKCEASEAALSETRDRAVKALTDCIEQLDAIIGDGMPTDFRAWRDDMQTARSEFLKDGGDPESRANLVGEITPA